MKEYKGTAALDAGLISSAQAVEHYEITRYGTLRRWAEMLGKRNAASLLDRSLREESQTDEQLNMIAEQANQTARKPGAKKAPKRSAARRPAKEHGGSASAQEENASTGRGQQAGEEETSSS
jgi:hypothetical protein